jgi:hypothetical protein
MPHELEPASSGCGQTIKKDGRCQPSGFVHASCVSEYFETTEIVVPARHFSADLSDQDAADFTASLG